MINFQIQIPYNPVKIIYKSNGRPEFYTVVAF